MVWVISTVPISIVPFVLTYMFGSYINGKWLDIKEYTSDIVLMICSVYCGLIVFAFDSSKYISDKLKMGSRIFACFVAIISGSFYFTLLD